MCEAFSCIVRHDGKVFYKAGMDSHEDLKKYYKLKDIVLGDKKTPALCPIEITPKNNDYLNPDKWVFHFDIGGAEKVEPPYWWTKKMEKDCWTAHKKWIKEIYSKINLKEARKPIHPFKIKAPKITKKHEELVRRWFSVGDSVGDSVRDSVYAYIGSLFCLKRSEWKYTKKIKCRGYPFQCAIVLWKQGLVPACDGNNWMLLGSPKGNGKCEILWKELIK